VTGVRPADLAAHSFVTGLAEGHIAELAALARPTEIGAGQRIFAEGEPATRLWLIRSGRVALDLQVPGRELLIVETLGPGDELGLSWLAPVAEWQFGAVAQVSVTAFEFAAADVMALCEVCHELGYRLTGRLLGTAISRLQAARIRILDLYAPPAPLSIGGPR
jgi:CRP/FNR family transcriptional regulator, cyclic AMP receptor protein